jgi:hypothetical protein
MSARRAAPRLSKDRLRPGNFPEGSRRGGADSEGSLKESMLSENDIDKIWSSDRLGALLLFGSVSMLLEFEVSITTCLIARCLSLQGNKRCVFFSTGEKVLIGLVRSEKRTKGLGQSYFPVVRGSGGRGCCQLPRPNALLI